MSFEVWGDVTLLAHKYLTLRTIRSTLGFGLPISSCVYEASVYDLPKLAWPRASIGGLWPRLFRQRALELSSYRDDSEAWGIFNDDVTERRECS